MKKAIVIGASSGIGKALAVILAEQGYAVGLVARRGELLKELQQQIGSATTIKVADIAEPDEAMRAVTEMINETGPIDLAVLSSGVGFINKKLDWQLERQTIDVNVRGFTAMADLFMQRFIEQQHGHLVSISSIAALRGNGYAPAYNASKAYVSNYVEGLRQKAFKLKLPIYITDIQPGFVDTPMAQGDNRFWMATAEKAARQIYRAIVKKRKLAYVTKRWRLIAWLLKYLPDALYYKLL